MKANQLMVSDQDFLRLNALIQISNSDVVDLLEEELARAEIVPEGELPSDIVAMNSLVRFRDRRSGKETEIQVVYPHDADANKSRVSILAPMGAALIGLRVGQEIEWPVPGGRVRRIEVLTVSHAVEVRAS